MRIQGTISVDGVTIYDVTGYMRRDDDGYEKRIEINDSNMFTIAMLDVKDIESCEVILQDEDGRYIGDIIEIISDGEIMCDELL